ncbi:MAG: helix-turn-helix domain-containing protein [Ginsengibacter sp.]
MSREINEEYLKAFAKRFKELRKEKGLTLQEVGKEKGLDLATVQRIEKSSQNVTIGMLLKLARGLKIHPKELFDFDHSEFL